jgi:UDP-glucose 6-dehydrogenase
MKITIVGTGYVGLSNAVLLAQQNEVVAIDIVPEKAAMLNRKQSPIEDAEIEDYLQNKPLNLRATLNKQQATSNKQQAYEGADFVIIGTPTDYDSETNCFNIQSIEAVIRNVIAINPKATMVINRPLPWASQSRRVQRSEPHLSARIPARRSGPVWCLRPPRIVVVNAPSVQISLQDYSRKAR